MRARGCFSTCSRRAQIELFFGFAAALSVSLSNFDLCGAQSLTTRTVRRTQQRALHAQLYVFIVELALLDGRHVGIA